MKIKEENFNKGRFYEDKAKVFLENKGYVWVVSNYSNKIGELDLVMRDRDWLVFVEVKYKTDDSLGIPEEMITNFKLSQVKKVAESYVFLEHPKQKKYRIDAVCILGSEVRHYENI